MCVGEKWKEIFIYRGIYTYIYVSDTGIETRNKKTTNVEIEKQSSNTADCALVLHMAN